MRTRYCWPLWFIILSCLGSTLLTAGCMPIRRDAGSQGSPQRIGQEDLPKTPPADSLAVFNFAPKGDPDAKFYAIGFARALADRLYCAPKSVTEQVSANALQEQLCVRSLDISKPLSADAQDDIAKALGVRYAVTGLFELNSGNVSVTVKLRDRLSHASPRTMSLTGRLADLPSMQAKLAKRIVEWIKLRPNRRVLRNLEVPNFTKPEALALYGQSVYSATNEEAKALRWQAVDRDPHALFPKIRRLEFYLYGPATYREIHAERRLPGYISRMCREHPDNSHLNTCAAWLLMKEFKYKKAQEDLERILRQDPDFSWAHDALMHVAKRRGDSRLAVKEGERLVSLWPTSARAHAVLADAYGAAAFSARRGHFYGEMTRSREREWRKNEFAAYREASIAVRLDRNYPLAWYTILDASRSFGDLSGVKRAFKELTRLDPKDVEAYVQYAFSYSPQWGGSAQDEQRVFSMADKTFGKGSWGACLVRGRTLMCNIEHEEQRPEILRLAEQAILDSKGECLDALELKCRVLIGLKRRAEMFEVAKKGFRTYPSPTWRMLLARGYEFKWEDQRDVTALTKAERLLRTYVAEIPFDTEGHNHLGWCLSHLGKRKEAKREFLTVLKLDPANDMAREKLRYVQ